MKYYLKYTIDTLSMARANLDKDCHKVEGYDSYKTPPLNFYMGVRYHNIYQNNFNKPNFNKTFVPKVKIDSSPLSAGVITLRKINLFKNQLYLVKTPIMSTRIKDSTSNTVGLLQHNKSMADCESALSICNSKVTHLTHLQTSSSFHQNEQIDFPNGNNIDIYIKKEVDWEQPEVVRFPAYVSFKEDMNSSSGIELRKQHNDFVCANLSYGKKKSFKRSYSSVSLSSSDDTSFSPVEFNLPPEPPELCNARTELSVIKQNTLVDKKQNLNVSIFCEISNDADGKVGLECAQDKRNEKVSNLSKQGKSKSNNKNHNIKVLVKKASAPKAKSSLDGGLEVKQTAHNGEKVENANKRCDMLICKKSIKVTKSSQDKGLKIKNSVNCVENVQATSPECVAVRRSKRIMKTVSTNVNSKCTKSIMPLLTKHEEVLTNNKPKTDSNNSYQKKCVNTNNEKPVNSLKMNNIANIKKNISTIEYKDKKVSNNIVNNASLTVENNMELLANNNVLTDEKHMTDQCSSSLVNTLLTNITVASSSVLTSTNKQAKPASLNNEGKKNVVQGKSFKLTKKSVNIDTKINCNLHENITLDEMQQCNHPKPSFSELQSGRKKPQIRAEDVKSMSIIKRNTHKSEKTQEISPEICKSNFDHSLRGGRHQAEQDITNINMQRQLRKRKTYTTVTEALQNNGSQKSPSISTKSEIKKSNLAVASAKIKKVDVKKISKIEPTSEFLKDSNSIFRHERSLKFVGAHCSIAGGISNAVKEAVSLGARAIGLFVRNGRTWKLSPLKAGEADKFKEACKVHGFSPQMILPHGSYLLNCGSSNPSTLQKSRDTLIHEMQICEQLGLDMYNFHPGSACGQDSVNDCLQTISESINIAHQKTNHVKAVIENMSCQGSTVGGKFEELRAIIDGVNDKSRIGVCLDTCHAFAAGFDLSTESGFNKCLDDFDKIIGLQYLCAVHINDSKGKLGCHLDRHENIGKGNIGIDGFRSVMNDSRLNNIPMILETPVNDYAKEIKLLYDLEKL